MHRIFSTKALTMMETLTMIVILGIVLFLTLPRLATSKYTSERAAVKAKAMQLNIAKDAFVAAEGVNNAQDTWNTHSSNNDRWDLVKPFLPAELSSSLVLNYSSSYTYFGVPGYFLNFNDIVTSPVTIYIDDDLDGSVDTSTATVLGYQ